jgi:hypothetical protein
MSCLVIGHDLLFLGTDDFARFESANHAVHSTLKVDQVNRGLERQDHTYTQKQKKEYT